LRAEITTSDSSFCKKDKSFIDCDILRIYTEIRKPYVDKWYNPNSVNYFPEVPHCYNDIHKIKAIIDERVAYFLSLENNQTNTMGVPK
jgi:hypothetical protein